MNNYRETIALRVIDEFKDGDIVNIGAGVPSLIPKLLPKDLRVLIHSENGIIGEVALPEEAEPNPFVVNASNIPCAVRAEGCFIDTAISFGVVRGGHLDYTVLGAMQVDEEGNLANYMVPGNRVVGMGGAMDLVSGARSVFVAMDHRTREGAPKIKKRCAYPLTGARVVNKIFTELCVIEVTARGLLLLELMNGATLEEVIEKTEAELLVPDHLK
jgi:acetate CoA/acetoacetate CoA-transferase beta subunit